MHSFVSSMGRMSATARRYRKLAEVFRTDGCVVKVFSDDHNPAHVHVTSAEYEVKIDISGSVAIPMNIGKRRQNSNARFTKKALRLVNQRLPEVKAAWESIHGK